MGELVVEKSLEILAAAQSIWEELIRPRTWPEWKPFVKKAQASPAEELALGSRLKMSLVMGGPVAVPLSVTISEFERGKKLAWSGGVPGVVAATHSFVLEEKGGATRVVSREEFKGALLWLLLLLVTREDLENLHEQWLQAIHARMEAKKAGAAKA